MCIRDSFAASRTQSGRERVLAIFERIPSTRQAMYELALSRFTSALATYIAAGITTETAMRQALETVRHSRLRARLEYALEEMCIRDRPKLIAMRARKSARMMRRGAVPTLILVSADVLVWARCKSARFSR